MNILRSLKIASSNKIDEFHVNKKSEAALLLEIEHLKDDNVRLLQMLKTTDEQTVHFFTHKACFCSCR